VSHPLIRLAASLTLPLLVAFAVPRASAAQADDPECGTTITIDSPSPGAVVSSSLLIRGWALDPTQSDGSGISGVSLYLDGEAGTGAVLGAATLGQFRPDVDAFFSRPSSQPGWSFAWNLGTVAPGSHTVYIYAQDACGSPFVALSIVVSPAAITVDRPPAEGNVTEAQPLSVGGWAFDPGAPTGSGIDAVHVYVDGEAGGGAAVGAAAIGQARADVAAALNRPAAANSGFNLDARLANVLPGLHTLYVYAHGAQGWSYRTLPFNLAAASLQRPSLPPGRLFPSGASGFSISWPQCSQSVPTPPYQLALIGVTGGRAFYQNPCLPTQFAWARAAAAAPAVYMNLNAPAGRTAGRGRTGPAGECNLGDRGCLSFNYGYNAALHAVAFARSQGVAVPFWWLDVETENTWFEDRAQNARVIQGAIESLRAQALGVGVYSTAVQWNEIAGSFNPGLPVWVAGASSRSQAPSFCSASASFGGGPVALVQYPNGSFSGEYAC